MLNSLHQPLHIAAAHIRCYFEAPACCGRNVMCFAAIVLLLRQQPSAFLVLLLPGCLAASLPWCAANDIVHAQDHFCCLSCAQQHLQHNIQHSTYDTLQCYENPRRPQHGVQAAPTHCSSCE
jgi:hypothetical protein